VTTTAELAPGSTLAGSGLVGSGPAGSGPAGSGPEGSGPEGSGPAGSAPAGLALAPPAVAYPPDGSVRPVGRFTWEPAETVPLPDSVAAELAGRSILLVGGGERSAAALAAALAQAGATAHRLAPSQPADQLARYVAGLGPVDGIIDLNVEDPLAVTGPGGWESALQQSIGVLQAVYADWVTEADATRLFYLAVTRMGGHMGFGAGEIDAGQIDTGQIDAGQSSQPLGGLWAGLAKGLPRELPTCNIKVLDLSPELAADPDGTAALVRRELYRWGAFEIGYRDGRRYTLAATAAPVPPPRISIRPGDVVVLSGGGRGIGFALARALAANFGATVIVSGRGAPPSAASDPPVTMSAAEFRRYRDDQLRKAAADRRLPEVRASLERLEQDRELHANLTGARADGLRIEYVQCDIADPVQVASLLDAAGDRLTGIVHNAGVDIPVRLPGKTPEIVAAVVRVKVAGFFNLLAAAQRRPAVSFFCNTGSLTGRWGGMTGQLDYGAANECLSRLGLWARHAAARRGTALTTVCWPTWERLGMITNYEATLRYMSALDVSEGLYHWQRELLAGQPGEVTFIGDVGSAMLPSVLRGYEQDWGLPGIEGLASSRFYLGRPLAFRPHASISAANVLRAETMPCCYDFRIDAEPALPVSLCLEFLLSTGDWVLPDGDGRLRLAEARNVAVELAGLRAGSGRSVVNLVKEAHGRWADGAWQVTAAVARDGRQLASAELFYRAGDPASEPVQALPEGLNTVPPPQTSTAGAMRWNGHTFGLTTWARDQVTGRWYGRTAADRAADLLPVPALRSVLGFNQVENLVRIGWARQPQPVSPGRLLIRRLRINAPSDGAAGWLSGDRDGRDWTGHDAAGRVRLRVDGLQFAPM
jgi:NAD(P)-dependent dehydrogenase (short-subunit alcohol dehydrogenase family)